MIDNKGDFMFYNLLEHILANTNNTINDIITRDTANDPTYDRKNTQQMIHALMKYMSYIMACIFIVYAAGCGNNYWFSYSKNLPLLEDFDQYSVCTLLNIVCDIVYVYCIIHVSYKGCSFKLKWININTYVKQCT